MSLSLWGSAKEGAGGVPVALETGWCHHAPSWHLAAPGRVEGGVWEDTTAASEGAVGAQPGLGNKLGCYVPVLPSSAGLCLKQSFSFGGGELVLHHFWPFP